MNFFHLDTGETQTRGVQSLAGSLLLEQVAFEDILRELVSNKRGVQTFDNVLACLQGVIEVFELLGVALLVLEVDEVNVTDLELLVDEEGTGDEGLQRSALVVGGVEVVDNLGVAVILVILCFGVRNKGFLLILVLLLSSLALLGLFFFESVGL